MEQPIGVAAGSGITCIDAGYIGPGVACLYLVEQDGECAIIETGTAYSVARLQSVMAARAIEPEQVRYVVPTHVHLDHAGGAGSMMAAFPRAQLLIHPRGAPHMIDPEKLITSARSVYGARRFRELYGQIVPIPRDRIREIGDGEVVSLGCRVLEFRHTRGHAEHHFCIWDETSGGWFSGDMFGISYPWLRFAGADFVLPATTPTQFDPDAYLDSLQMLASYRPRRIYLTHFGELPYTEELTSLLARQVAGYRDLAPAYALDKAALEQALSDYTLGLLRVFDPAMPQVELRQRLAFDMDLNAQGLKVWLQRRAAAP